MAIPSSILAWRIPRTEEPGRLYSIGSQRVRHDWGDLVYSWNCGQIDCYFCFKMCNVQWPVSYYSIPIKCLLENFFLLFFFWSGEVKPHSLAIFAITRSDFCHLHCLLCHAAIFWLLSQFKNYIPGKWNRVTPKALHSIIPTSWKMLTLKRMTLLTTSQRWSYISSLWLLKILGSLKFSALKIFLKICLRISLLSSINLYSQVTQW